MCQGIKNFFRKLCRCERELAVGDSRDSARPRRRAGSATGSPEGRPEGQLKNAGPSQAPNSTHPRRTPSNTGPRRTPSNTGPRRTPSNTGPRRTPSNTGPRRTPSSTGPRRAPSSTGRTRIREQPDLAGNNPDSQPESGTGGGPPSRSESQSGNPGEWPESQGGNLEERLKSRSSNTEDRQSHESAEAIGGIAGDYQNQTRTPSLDDDKQGAPSGPGTASAPDFLTNRHRNGSSTVIKRSRSGEAAGPVEDGNKDASHNRTWLGATADGCGGLPGEGEGFARDQILDEVRDIFDREPESRMRGENQDRYNSGTNTSIQSYKTRGDFDGNSGSNNNYGNKDKRFVNEGTIVNEGKIEMNFLRANAAEGPASTAVAVREQAPYVPWTVTYCKNRGFTGREGILKKVESLAQMEGHNRIALWGLGGTGKTQIALEFVYQYGGGRPVFWVHGSSLGKFREEFLNTIPYGGIPEAAIHGKDDESRLASVKKWFESPSSGEWILVVDNADNESDFYNNSSPIAKYIPQGSKGALIITTRSRLVASRLGCHGGSAIEVKGMNSNEAMKLFLSRYEVPNRQEEKWAAKDILRSLHNLPLAVVGAAAYMTETSTMPSEYLDMFNSEDSAKRLLSQEFSDIYREPPGCVAESILSTFFITFEQIKERYHLAMDLLRLITFLTDHQNIQEDLLRYSGLPGMDVAVTARNTIGKLMNFSLVTKTASSVGDLPVYEFHRLVQISAEVYIREREGVDVSIWVNVAQRAEKQASRNRLSFTTSSWQSQLQPSPGIE